MGEVIELLEDNVCSYSIQWHRTTSGDSYKIDIDGGDGHVSGDFPDELIEEIGDYIIENYR